MILVAAPEGHDTGESRDEEAGFDNIDLDAILQNRSASPVPKPRPASAARPARMAAAPVQRPGSNPVAKPPAMMQPGEGWVNPATKRKQKAIVAVMATLLGLLVLSVAGWYMLQPREPEKRVATGDGIEVAEETLPADHELNSEAETHSEAEAELDSEPNSDPVDPKLADEDAAKEDPIPSSVVPDAPPAIPGLELPSDPPMIDDGPAEEPHREPEPGTRSDAAVLRSVLAESGTSMIKLRNAASRAREDFSIGTPKYFFEKVDQPIDFTLSKDQQLLGISYKQQRLQSVIHELTSITGLRLTINAPEIFAANRDLDPEVTLTLENESAGTMVREISKSVGFVATETDHGFVLSYSGGDTPKSESVNVAAIVENQNDGDGLAKLVQQMVWPGTWQGDPLSAQARGQCQYADGSLQLKHLPAAVAEANRFINGLKAAAQKPAGASSLLDPVLWIDGGEFAAPFAPQNSERPTMGDFFRSLKRDYEIQVMADWHALGSSGWTSDSYAAGWIEEPSVGEVIREVARAMKVGVYVVDQRTVWLTSPETVNQINILKLYPLNEIANGKLSEEVVRTILRESLGGQVLGTGVIVAFERLNRENVLVLRAPQMLHRQVESVLNELR